MIPALALLKANWRIPVAFITGAALCWPVASCQGRRDGKANVAAKVAVASSKATESAAKAEVAAIVADAVRRGEAKAIQTELQEIVREEGSDALAGPGVSSVLARLRQANRGGADTRP